MKKRLLMTIGTAVALCVVATFQFLKSDFSLLRAQGTEISSVVEETKDSIQASSEKKETEDTTSEAPSSSKEKESSVSTSPSVPSSSSSEAEAPASSSSSASESTSSSQNSSNESSTGSTGSSQSNSGSQSSSGNKESSSSSSSSDSDKKDSSTTESTEPVGVATKEEVEENYTFSISKNSTTQEFIDSIKKDAQQVAWDSDLYASVMMAQAILETGSGNSSLSRSPNYNLFGIKGEYKDKSVSFPTQEDDGSGTLYTIEAKFRKYPSVKESLEDYAKLLKTDFYKGTWKSNTESYKDATEFLTGRYATDTTYNKKLNALIAAYDLTDFDVEPGTDPEDAKETEKKKKDALAALAKSKGSSLTENEAANSSLAELLGEFSNLTPDYDYNYDTNGGSSSQTVETRAKEILASESAN